MDTCPQTLIITNDIAEITRTADFIENYCMAQGAAMDVVFKINLAVEEALVNTITHGFTGDACHEIVLEINAENGMIVLTIVDDAVAFDPLAAPMPDVDSSADERDVGGLGVFLMRTTMDDVQYAREGRTNKLTLRKSFQDTPLETDAREPAA